MQSQEAEASRDLRSDVRRLRSAAIIYLMPLVVGRGLNFLLAPVYTRVMSSAEYGVVGLATSITPLVTMVLGFGLSPTVSRLHFQLTTEAERREFHGSITTLQLTLALALTFALFGLGYAGHLDVFQTVRFRPHLEIILWAAYLGIFHNVVLSLYVVREEPRNAAIFSTVASLVTVAVTVWLVIVQRQGAMGQIRATAYAALVVAVIALVSRLRMYGIAASIPQMRRALAFGLPLVPHQLSNWALAASDRWILERRIDAHSLGQYSLGYTFGTAAGMLTTAISQAVFPIVMRRLSNPEQAADVPRLGTCVLVLTATPCLGLALLSHDAIVLLTPKEYHDAAGVVPWVVLGFVFQVIYGLWSQGTYFSGKTLRVPLVTAVAAAANVTLNLIFVPRFGMLAAAVNTAVAYAVLAALHGWLAHRLFPIAWEYRRWFVVIGLAAACYAFAELSSRAGSLTSIVLKAVVAGALFPGALLLLRVVSAADLAPLLPSRLLRKR